MIEATDLFEYFLCPYKVYNRHNRDKSLMLPPDEFTKRLMELGIEHERELVAALPVVRPKYPRGDLQRGFLETQMLMLKGTEFIHQGVIKDEEKLGIPDLLIRQEGKSKLGKWHYVAADIKSSIRPKEEQIMQLLFYNKVLEKIQGRSSKEGMLMLKNATEIIDLSLYEEKFNEAVEKVKALSKGKEFGLHIDNVCKSCPWRNVCIPIAEKTKDASLVYGLSRSIHYKLLELGIKTLDDLKKADESKLLEIDGVGEVSVKKWKEQAEVLLTKEAKITKAELPKTKNEICLDIESAEDGRMYLIGLLRDGKFTHFFSETDEKEIVNRFVDYVLALGDYRLYHYGNIEKTTFTQMFKKYNVDEKIAHSILGNMIDLFPLVKKHAVLPITFYNLKDVAKYLGYKWRAADASGGNSMTWYDAWIHDKDPKLLKKILEYNEDDVKATALILKKISK
jgi:uncharacterized protein